MLIVFSAGYARIMPITIQDCPRDCQQQQQPRQQQNKYTWFATSSSKMVSLLYTASVLYCAWARHFITFDDQNKARGLSVGLPASVNSTNTKHHRLHVNVAVDSAIQ